MREIKFRVWDKKWKIWLEPEDHVIYADNGDVGEVNNNELVESIVHDTVVEKYTGLKDRNGVEIYEGDIVRQQMRFTETNGIIFWQEEKARFAINLDGFITTITKQQEMSYEVVGNIHNNPELLEET